MSARRRLAGCAARAALLGSLAFAVRGQDPDFETLALRVTSVTTTTRVVVDRGSFDRLQVGDRVRLLPRNGRVHDGRVALVDDRSAVVELSAGGTGIVPGTRGEVLVPKDRPRRAAPAVPPAARHEPPSPDRPGAQRPDDGWRPGMPLLAGISPQRPSQRTATVTGRAYATGDLVYTLEDTDQSYLRAGTSFDAENLLGNGETLTLDTELVLATEVTDLAGADLRLYELSYTSGGTRFSPTRLQLGRFRQQSMPEFGILDGAELSHRFGDAGRGGISLGYLPELDDDLDSFADLALAAWYLWSPDLDERFTIGLGVQKTWHRGNPDRDLVVAKLRYLPASGFVLDGSVWVDFYDSGDPIKGSGVEITRAHVFAGRDYTDEGGWNLTYDHDEYPDTLRDEFTPPVAATTLADAHKDALSVRGWWRAGDDWRWHTRLTGWIDEERTGGALDLGVEIGDPAATARFEGFASQALSFSVTGLRVGYGRSTEAGRWDFLYELGFVHFEGFPPNVDDLLQHRLQFTLSSDLGAGWDLSTHADVVLWDNEPTYALGFYLQRVF